MRDYDEEDFEKPQKRRYPTTGEEFQKDRKTMGLGREISKPGKYAEFYRQKPVSTIEDYEKGLIAATAPVYKGPKNTRCDIYELENGRFQINGKVNHAQSSCVYLKQNISVTISDPNHAGAYFFQQRLGTLRPFSIQKQFTRMLWSSQQTAQDFDTSIEQNVKLAPYIVSKHSLDRMCKYKCNARPIVKANTLDNTITFNYSLFEPLLGFQSGWAMLEALRPFDQQNSRFPLAIQDYNLDIQTVTTRKSLVKRVLRDNMKATIDNSDLEILDQVLAVVPTSRTLPGSGNLNIKFPTVDADQKYSVSPIRLVTFTTDGANQQNKSTSSISLHAPVFFNHKTSVLLPEQGVQYDDHRLAENQNFVSKPIIMGGADTLSPDAPELKVKFSTSKGFPSYFMVYLESEGCDYYSDISPNNGEFATDNLIGAHPKIASMAVKLFDQAFPICRQLESVEELEYLTRKNCHKECDFDTNMRYDPIVLLRLEDLGLATESVGYPHKKRLEMEVEVKQIILPKYAYQEVAGGNGYKVNLTCSLIYENHCLQGTANHAEFYGK